MGDLKIVCPSKGRHNKVMTKDLVDDLVLLVPNGEGEIYRLFNPQNEVIETPKDLRGITATKQWMLDNFDDWFSIDDDVHKVRKMYQENEEDAYVTDPLFVRDIILRCYNMAKEMKAYMFGFTKERNPLMYVSQNPFRFKGYMNSSHFGVISGNRLYYNLDMNEGEDHWLSCLNAYTHRYFLMDTRYAFFTKDNFMARGGCNDYRTEESMKKNTILLRRVFGEVVQIKRPVNHRKNVNYGERSISIPL